LKKVKYRRLTDGEVRQFGGESLERLPFQSVYLLRAVRLADRSCRLEVYREHVEHHGHIEPPATVATVARARSGGEPRLEKTAVLYVDSRPPEKLDVDFIPSR
jgi:hypothetical protein